MKKSFRKKKKQLKSSGLGDNFNPDKHIADFIQGIEDKLKNRPKRNPKDPNKRDSGSDSGSGTGRGTTPLDPFKSNSDSTQKDWFQTNKHLVIFAGIAILVIFYLYSQSSKSKEEKNYYDF